MITPLLVPLRRDGKLYLNSACYPEDWVPYRNQPDPPPHILTGRNPEQDLAGGWEGEWKPVHSGLLSMCE